MKNATILLCLLLLSSCEVNLTEPPETFSSVYEELEVRINEVNRVLVKCWEIPGCKNAELLTWTDWRNERAPHFIVRKPIQP